MAGFDEQWTQVSEWCITVMPGLFASICIFTILHSSEQFVPARNIAIFRVDMIVEIWEKFRNNDCCVQRLNIDPRKVWMYGQDCPRGLWLLMIFAAPCWRLMREYERCELCGPRRRGGAHLYAIDGALSSVLTSSLLECQRPTYNQAWSQAPAGHQLSVSDPCPHH